MLAGLGNAGRKPERGAGAGAAGCAPPSAGPGARAKTDVVD